MAINASELQYVIDLVLRKSGIVLDSSKEYLVEARVGGMAKSEGLGSISALLAQVRGPNGAAVERGIVDAMTTNETSFYRDLSPFDAVRKAVLPEIIARRAAERRLAIWCAASSTGQEPYSLAMLMRESFPQLAGWNITFIASDLSRDVLERARAGRFSQLEVNRGLPATLLVKYFKKCGLDWEISPDIRKMVDFREVNLLETWPAMPLLDIVFIRNVLIYFGSETKTKILGRIRGMMHPAGYLFLGGAETTMNLDDRFERVPVEKTGCYRIRARTVAAAA
jgi:chemotaxis protein methyltransferase CheR